MFSSKTVRYNFLICIISFLAIVLGSHKAWAENDSPDEIPNHYGLGISFGHTYDPRDDIPFLQLNAFALCDYEKVWRHAAPEPLRFKVACNLGITTNAPYRTIASVNAFALYYLDDFTSRFIRPYGEAGIGIIYTDFKVKGQGLRINFNPQFGIGTEFLIDSKPIFYIAIRAHHISNGDLYHRANRSVNSVVLVAGKMF